MRDAYELVIDASVNEQSRRGRARLPLIEERSFECATHGGIEVGMDHP